MYSINIIKFLNQSTLFLIFIFLYLDERYEPTLNEQGFFNDLNNSVSIYNFLSLF